ncbi:MAG: hypothetical protein II882_01125 [Lachnospiraceae bacterium]|nr:hypothetical protein [Lachnospiraceae bacterium]
MSVYRKKYTLLSSDVDALQRLRLSRLFTMLQEASIAHTTELGMGREKTLDRGLLWIIAQQAVRVERLPVYDEPVVLSSWPGVTMHLYFPRFYRLETAGGELLTEGSALWALMDRESRHIIFPEEHGIHIEGETDPSDPPLPRLPRFPQAEEKGTFTVPYSYTDLNGHMNNTRYLDLAEDLMPPALRSKAPKRIEAEFSGEVGAGETMELNMSAAENEYYLSGSREKRLFRLHLCYT